MADETSLEAAQVRRIDNATVPEADENESAAESARLARQSQASAESDQSAAETARLQRQSEATTKTEVGGKKTIDRSRSRDNPLFAYANYTYGLSWHVIPPSKFNKMATTPGYQYTNDDSTVLVASAGRRNDTTFQRHPEFKEDFFFDNLKFTTVVGMNARNRNSNAVDINFTLIEPYGVTLINRLLAVVDELKVRSWMQIPFLLQIDFFGNDELGQVLHPIPDQTKYIPIRLIGCKVKVTPKGAEYQINAVPYSHQAFNETAAATPAFFEVQAKTIKDFFSSEGDAGEIKNWSNVKSASKEREEAEIKEATEYESNSKAKEAAAAGVRERYQKVNASLAKMPYLVGSYTAAINNYQDQLTQNNHQTKSEVYAFKFDPEFAESNIVVPKKLSSDRATMANPLTKDGVAAIRAQAGLGVAGTDTNKETFTINAGTNIIEVINMVMRNSDYIRNQFNDPAVDPPANGQAAADKEGKEINWYKIVPVIEIGDFDPKRDVYSKKITYHVKKYTYFNSKFRDAPKKQPDYYCKEYQYMYTGKNQSILDFNIDFDTMFYTSITADRAKAEKTKVQTQAPQDNKDDKQEKPTAASVQDKVVHPVSGQADMVNPASVDSKGVLVNDFSKSMMSSSRGDMVSLNLKVIGDPELIKQDDVFKNPENNPNQVESQMVDPNTGSIVYDSGEVFALIKFKTPVDFDPVTGLAKFEDFTTSVFSGVYKIISVSNEFANGQFTQTMSLVRIFDQPDFDTLGGKNVANKAVIENRSEDPKTIAEAKKAEEPPVDEFGGLDEAIATQQAMREAEAADAFYNPSFGASTEGNEDIDSMDEADQLALQRALEGAPTINYGDQAEDEYPWP